MEDLDAELYKAEPLIRFFFYKHMPAPFQDLMKPYFDLARHIIQTTPVNEERTIALRKLLESQDSSLRAHLL